MEEVEDEVEPTYDGYQEIRNLPFNEETTIGSIANNNPITIIKRSIYSQEYKDYLLKKMI